uniref:Uncharacterized protein n=1 Tax=Oryza punctata TaxID=4537 RepID=A0A0E0L633_ORYPU
MPRRFLFQKFSCVLSRSMANRPTSAEGGGVSAINNVFNGALRRFSTVLPNNHGLPVSQAKCLNSIQSPQAATKVNHPTIGVVPFEGFTRASRTFFSCTKPNHLPSLGATNYLESAAAEFEASGDAFRRDMRNIRIVWSVVAAIWCANYDSRRRSQSRLSNGCHGDKS